MQKVAQFEKVSFEQFQKDWLDTFYDDIETCKRDNLIDEITKIYEKIKLPKRATKGSAGYDFYSPLTFSLAPGETIKLPTGIRVRIEEGWVLNCYPRSGLGFKYRLQLNNTVGIIDSDYYASDNEGHIFCKMTNDSNEAKTVTIEEGMGFMQGIFTAYGITFDDDAEAIRNGGLGSTTKSKETTSHENHWILCDVEH
ncbi:MAG: deoxyuridine 5'-triphosphate nucleotidohydrolase [Clostridiales bacterium]|nr:deoxyuridine 5'-triphosphate nucleotidohydrolase [Clostridiales bacterium]